MSDINWDDLARENLLDTLKKHKRDIAQKDQRIAELEKQVEDYEYALYRVQDDGEWEGGRWINDDSVADVVELVLAKHKEGK